MVALEAEELVKKVPDGRGRRTLVDGVSLSVDRGELLVLAGRSGSGKTTLLALLAALLTPTSGEVRLDGVATSRLRDAHRAFVRRRTVGFVFQDAQLVPDLSARENVLLPWLPDGVPMEAAKRAEALLERADLSAVAASPARRLSGGEAARVALCRALVRDPAVVLFDEPTAHLDEGASARVVTDIEALLKDGRAVVVATHDVRLAAGLAALPSTRQATLEAGRLLKEDP